MPRRLSLLLRNWFRKPRVEHDLDDELSSYLALLTQEKIAVGMTPEEARRAARLEFGGAEQVKERVREARAGRMLEDFWQDVRYGARLLRRSSGFTVVVVLTLALGIGANTAIFSIVNAVLLRPLPFPEPDQLVMLWQSYPQRRLNTWWLSQANFVAYRDQNKVFAELAGYSGTGLNLSGIGEPERLRGANVTAHFFEVLRIQPARGRTFRIEEDSPGKNKVCILSHGLWQRRFGGDPQVLGQKIFLNGAPFEVVGVMPAEFKFPDSATQMWIPLGLDRARKSPFFIRGIARLKPGTSPSQAQTETTALLRHLGRDDSGFIGSNAPAPPGADLHTVVTPLKDAITGRTRQPLLVVLAAVGLVLLIACANVANLLLARATSRTREISLRLVLGASPVRIVRQLLTESLLVSLLGAAAGTVLAAGSMRFLDRLPVGGIPRIEEVSLDATVLFFTAAIALLTGILFGLAPAFRARRLGVQTGLREGVRSSAAVSARRANNLLVVAQFALSLILLVAAGLLLKSLERLLAVHPGFEPRNLLTLRAQIPALKYAEPPETLQFYSQLLERVRGLPGVRAAGLISSLPFTGDLELDGTIVEGHEPPPGSVVPVTAICWISPGLFQSMEIPVLRGRDFLGTDRADSPPVAIVDDTLARQFWPDGDALGKRIRFSWDTSENRWMTIVGVVSGIKDNTLALKLEPHLYIPNAQQPPRGMNLVIRTVSGAPSVAPAVRAQIRELDPDVPAFAIRTMTEQIEITLRPQRLTNFLLGSFALTALVLAAIGIYGVVSLEVNSRFQEFGIRMALGAQRRDVFLLVLFQAARLAAAGVLLGILGALAFTGFLGNLLYDVKPGDPATLAAVATLLSAVALLACYLPARRATRVDPMTALRYE